MKSHLIARSILSSFRYVVMAIMLAAISFAFVLFINRAGAEQLPDSPTAPGSIQGKITNEEGLPLNTGYINLYAYPYSGNVGFPTRSTAVDSTGNYTFSLLGPGMYRIGFYDSNQVYARQFYSNTRQFSEALEIPVIGSQISNVDATLHLAGAISGTLKLHNYTNSYRSTAVILFELTSSGWSEIYSTGGYDDKFQFRGLSTGKYRICTFSEPVDGGVWWIGCYGVAESIIQDLPHGYCRSCVPVESALNIAVTEGMTVTNLIIDMYRSKTQPLPDQPGIFGRVLSDKGVPLPGIRVQAHLSTTNGLDPIGVLVTTNPDGEYLLPLYQPGIYILSFANKSDEYSSYAAEYFENAETPLDATPIEWQIGQRIKGVEARIAEKPFITGSVDFIDGRRPVNANLTVWVKVGDHWEISYFYPQPYVDWNTGLFQVHLPSAGTYRIGATASLWGYSYNGEILTRFYGGSDLSSATDIPIGLNETRGDINIVLGEDDFEAIISGTVKSVDGQPLANIKVDLIRQNGFGASFIYTMTDHTGNYKFTNLINGSYQLRYSDPQYVYSELYYPNVAAPNSALLVPTTGDSPATIDMALPKAGAIEGILLNTDLKPIGNADVDLYLYSNGSYSDYLRKYKTDSNGFFRIKGLSPNHYVIWFYHDKLLNPSIPFGNLDLEWGYYISQPIVVLSGETFRADQTNFRLSRVYLPTIAR